MTANTPGPWTAFNKGMGDTEIIANNRVVCDCTFLDALDGSEFQANARLIAAAPDLLAALESLEKMTSNLPLPSVHNVIRAAIEKARKEGAHQEVRP